MKAVLLVASLALSSFALCGVSPAQDNGNGRPPDNNQPPAQPTSLEDQVARLERQQQVMQWQLDDLRKQVAALQRSIDRLGQGGGAPQAAESAPGSAQTTASSNGGNGEVKGGGNLNSYALFYTRLQSQGKWLQDPTYGYVWQPARAAEDQNWRPYTDGHWVYTDRGWTWVSNEGFGWATYHYGRWARRSDTGWVWVPGNEWGPAWVSWRESEGQGQGDGYVGWAPLPPEAEANQNVRIENWADGYYDIGPTAYVFIRTADLAQPSYRRVIVPPAENATVIARTRNVTNLHYTDKGFDLGGPDYTRIEQEAHVRVPHYDLTYSTPERGEEFRTVVRGNQLEFFAPPPRLQAESATRPEVARTLTRVAIDRGWRELDQTQAEQLRQTFERQAPVPAGLPPSRVEQARTVTTEGTQPGQSVGAPVQQGATPAQAVATPAPAQGATRAAQAGATPAQAGTTPAQAGGMNARTTAGRPSGRPEGAEGAASPAARADGQGHVAQPAETPNSNRRNLTQESRDRDLERRSENENVRTGEPARTSRQAEAERPAGNQPVRQTSSDNGERRRQTSVGRDQTLNTDERREAPKREEPAGAQKGREASTSKRETPPADGTGEAERPKHDAGEQRAERNSTPSARHTEENGASSERESQRHEAAPAKHRADDEGKHREGQTKTE